MRGEPRAAGGTGATASARRRRAHPRGVWLLAPLLAGAIVLSSAASVRAQDGLPNGFYGITPATRLSDEEFARMGAAKVGTLRMPFFWQQLQPIDRRHFDWQRTDRVLERAALNGIQVLPFVLGVPPWLRGEEKPPLDERGREAWSDLLSALADRYGTDGSFWAAFELLHPGAEPRPVGAWQIWNEPNDTSYWRPIKSAPERYAELLELSDRVLAEADPAASVAAAGLWEAPSDGIPMRRFLARLYRASAGGSFDAVAVHPYAGGVPGVVRQLDDARRVMRRFGDSRKPLWITELGWPTQHAVGGGGFVKSERRQEALLRRSFSRLLASSERYRLERLVWYTWRDNDLFEACNLCRYSGLFREDMTPKPAWDDFVAFTGGSTEAPGGPSGPSPPTPPVP
jgi:hypothetical protein